MRLGHVAARIVILGEALIIIIPLLEDKRHPADLAFHQLHSEIGETVEHARPDKIKQCGDGIRGLLNIADYLNGSQTRGEYRRRDIKIMTEMRAGVRQSVSDINREMRRLKIAATIEERRSKQRWVKALQALDDAYGVNGRYTQQYRYQPAPQTESDANRFDPNQCAVGSRPVYVWAGNGYQTECR